MQTKLRRGYLLNQLRAASMSPEVPAELRSAVSALIQRADFAELAGQSFRGDRNIYESLGYQRILKPTDYRGRYNRGGIAKRIVEAFPRSTWRGGGELVEDEDPDNETPFEKAFADLNKRLKVWTIFERADILAGLGRFSVILLGAPGKFDEPLKKCKPEDLKYMTPFSERDVTVETLVDTTDDERFGLPTYYNVRRIGLQNNQSNSLGLRVHYSRIIHVADGLLDDPLFGTPRLMAPWNYLDDLDKVVGGGAEAFWKRADRGMHVKIDPTLTATDTMVAELKDNLQEYTDRLKRNITTQGVDLVPMGSDVAQFNASAATLIDLISATTGIPQRILMGSERGQLASSNDQTNYDDRVQDRRDAYAGPVIVQPFVQRMQEFGILPECDDYEARWPEIEELDEKEKMELAYKAAQTNQAQGETVITSDEIREMLGREPLTDQQKEQLQAEADARNVANPDNLENDAVDAPDDPKDIRVMSAKSQRLMKLKKRKSKGGYW